MRPIDADKAKETFIQVLEEIKKRPRMSRDEIHIIAACDTICEILDDEPTVDSVSVVHGHWIYDPNGMDWNLGAWRCSKCGCKNNNIGGDERINPLLFAGSKYCPNCGCKMSEDTEREDVHD